MAEPREQPHTAPMFEGLPTDEAPPKLALFQVGPDGRPHKKLASLGADPVKVNIAEVGKHAQVALGPDVSDAATLTRDKLVVLDGGSLAKLWRDGVVIPKDIWTRFLYRWVCVSGRARKCRPWHWNLIELMDASVGALSGLVTLRRSMALEPANHIAFPTRCVPLCDGIVEVYERTCCCRTIWIPCLLERLREILERLPIPLPPLVPPPPEPPVGPIGPRPGPDPLPMTAMFRRAPVARTASLRSGADGLDRPDAPSQRLYDDYVRLCALERSAAEQYVLERPYLRCIACTCTTRKLGDTVLQAGGRFDFCFQRPIIITIPEVRCHSYYAVKIRQLINGHWVTVYDGVGAGDWYTPDEIIQASTFLSAAVPCGSDPGDPPPSDGVLPFIMLERVGSTHHFNFPAQSAPSALSALSATSGLVDTSFAPDCPWAASLGLRLWVSPDLDGTAVYYRLSTVAVDAAGNAVGAPAPLPGGVSWSYFTNVGGNWVVLSKSLDAPPATVGGKVGLHRIPYNKLSLADPDPNREFWLSDQYHGVWSTATGSVPNGRYMLVIEVFDGAGNQIKPNSAPAAEPGAARPFELRRWTSTLVTANIPHSDAAHAFWINNTPVSADLVDLRQNGNPNTASCQFMQGDPVTDFFSVGFKAYHNDTPSHPTFSFLYNWALSWERGLNPPPGGYGTLDSGTTEQGSGSTVAQSAQLSFGAMLGGEPACSFSVTLAARGKHFNGDSRIWQYDYWETAAFALMTGKCVCSH